MLQVVRDASANKHPGAGCPIHESFFDSWVGEHEFKSPLDIPEQKTLCDAA
jgi:hypothetical protein